MSALESVERLLMLPPLNSEADLARELEVVAAEVVVAEVMGERAEREDAPFR